MTDSKKMIPLSELTLLDRFLFDTVMENEDIHKTILQIILGRDIALLTKNQTEKELRTSPLLRSIRMDVYAMDEEKIIYNSEMQKQLIDAGKYAQEKVLKYQIEQADAAKKYLIDNGLQVSQLEDEDVWKKAAMEKVWPEMADFVGGKETINAYLKACGKPLWK